MKNDISFDPDLHFQEYDNFRENTFTVKRIKHSDVVSLTNELKKNEHFRVKALGYSIEKRIINLLSIGNGPVNILCWSQMHGNESTATMALFDLFNFFKNNFHSDLKEYLYENLTLHFIPMLNPDGAERFIRENALNIDLNRDALKLISPESKILKSAVTELQPLIGFNLHDQKIYYSAGYSPNPATISFLAPAFNFEKDINETRKNAMQVIGNISKMLEKYIPGSIAKYDDEFEPRAFGDNIMKWGTGTVLIESGGYKDDYEKQFIRKLNYISLLTSFYSIASGNYKKTPLEVYNKIPENRERLFDLKIKNVSLEKDGNLYQVDLGINRHEITKPGSDKSYYQGVIENIGDLSTFYGYEEFDASGFTISEAKISEESFTDHSELINLLCAGIMYIKWKHNQKVTNLFINTFDQNIPSTKIELENPANFYLSDKEKKIRYAVVNGFLTDLSSENILVPNCIHFG